MAVTVADCQRIVRAAKANGCILAVAHVLRYTPYAQKLKELIASGVVGEVVNIQHLEPVGHWHFAHSYVRGAWRKESESSFMLMAKACHDLDFVRYLMDATCERVSSMGSLQVFNPAKQPEGAAPRCLDCPHADTCPYSASRIYLDPVKRGHTGWPVNVITEGEPTVPDVEEALRVGPYGRCVWQSDNDVMDNQVVNMQFAGGKTATLTVVAFTEAICVRRTRIFGSMGEIEGDGQNTIRVTDFRTMAQSVYVVQPAPATTCLRGHNGADYHLIASFVKAVRLQDPSVVLSGPDDTLESHLMVFAAEQSRLDRSVVEMDAFGAAHGADAAGADRDAVGVKASAAAGGLSGAAAVGSGHSAFVAPPPADKGVP